MNIGKINIIRKKKSKIMLEFKVGALTAGKSDKIISKQKQAIAIAERETKNIKK